MTITRELRDMELDYLCPLMWKKFCHDECFSNSLSSGKYSRISVMSRVPNIGKEKLYENDPYVFTSMTSSRVSSVYVISTRRMKKDCKRVRSH